MPVSILQAHPLLALAAAVAGFAAMLAWRFRETTRPMTAARVVFPPLGMSTGLLMFVAPATRVPWTWGLLAFAIGAAVFAIPVARSARLVRRGATIQLERSRAFLWTLLALVAVRFALRAWVERYVTMEQSGALFYLLALGMIVRWRASMLRTFLALRREVEAAPPVGPAALSS